MLRFGARSYEWGTQEEWKQDGWKGKPRIKIRAEMSKKIGKSAKPKEILKLMKKKIRTSN